MTDIYWKLRVEVQHMEREQNKMYSEHQYEDCTVGRWKARAQRASSLQRTSFSFIRRHPEDPESVALQAESATQRSH